MTELTYYKMLVYIKETAKEKGVSSTSFINTEIKRLKKLADEEKEQNEFFKRITRNAGPRD